MMMGMRIVHALVTPQLAKFLISQYHLETIHTVCLQGHFSQRQETCLTRTAILTFIVYQMITQTLIVSHQFQATHS